MYTFTADATGVVPMSFSRPYSLPFLSNEDHAAYEERTWRNRLHVNQDEHIFIPAMMITYAMQDAAKRIGDKIVGRRGQTYTKYFDSGIVVSDGPLIHINGKPVKAEVIEGERLFLDANGKRNSGTRVIRIMPVIPAGWTAQLRIEVLDEILKPAIVAKALVYAGQHVGFGRWSPRQKGIKGRFKIENCTVERLPEDEPVEIKEIEVREAKARTVRRATA